MCLVLLCFVVCFVCLFVHIYIPIYLSICICVQAWHTPVDLNDACPVELNDAIWLSLRWHMTWKMLQLDSYNKQMISALTEKLNQRNQRHQRNWRHRNLTIYISLFPPWFFFAPSLSSPFLVPPCGCCIYICRERGRERGAVKWPCMLEELVTEQSCRMQYEVKCWLHKQIKFKHTYNCISLKIHNHNG